MKCPHCNVPLVMSERQGIEIDYCPECRGVWLDRGELDKIIERAAAAPAPSAGAPREEPRAAARGYERDHHHPHYKKKRKSFLDDLFDF